MTKNDDEEGCWRSYRHIIVLFLFLLLWLLMVVLFRDRLHMVAFLMLWSLGSRIDDEDQEESYEPSYSGWDQRCEKISNSSSFGIIDIADSSTTDRIIVIVETACFIHDGAYR